MSINLDGTANVQLLGRSWIMVPDLVLMAVPAEMLGRPWWQETASRFVYVNNPMRPLPNMAQGMTGR